MAKFRQIMVLIALVFTSLGNLPLAVHHLTCHHPHAAIEAVEKIASCSCSHHCVSTSATAPAVSENSHADECVVCFQLSQVSQSATVANVVASCPLSVQAVLPYLNVDLSAVDSPYPSRGPPVV